MLGLCVRFHSEMEYHCGERKGENPLPASTPLTSHGKGGELDPSAGRGVAEKTRKPANSVRPPDGAGDVLWPKRSVHERGGFPGAASSLGNSRPPLSLLFFFFFTAISVVKFWLSPH